MDILHYTSRSFRKQFAKALYAKPEEAHSAKVQGILKDIVQEGDAAVLRYTKRFDGALLRPKDLRVSEGELAAAAKALKGGRLKAVRESIACVKDFHKKTIPQKWRGKNPHGATVGENFYPINRVGLYIPGGQVPLVSTVVMTAIPALLAGCKEVAVCTPPRKDGSIDPFLLAALYLCGVREVYRVGGVQAIGALALGTKSIRAVDKIAGPGNAFVIEAKRQLFGVVGIDLLPGPSEVMISADTSADADFIASELLAQAEHGTGKERVFYATTDEAQVAAVKKACARQLTGLSHAQAITYVLQKRCTAIVVEDYAQLVEVTNEVAPEHLQLMVEPKLQESLAKQITTAGAILLGNYTPTALGDFVAGPSHTLPTGGTGRFASGLQVTDFMRRTSIVKYSKASIKKAAPTIAAFSEMEQLDAHGASVTKRLDS